MLGVWHTHTTFSHHRWRAHRNSRSTSSWRCLKACVSGRSAPRTSQPPLNSAESASWTCRWTSTRNGSGRCFPASPGRRRPLRLSGASVRRRTARPPRLSPPAFTRLALQSDRCNPLSSVDLSDSQRLGFASVLFFLLLSFFVCGGGSAKDINCEIMCTAGMAWDL